MFALGFTVGVALVLFVGLVVTILLMVRVDADSNDVEYCVDMAELDDGPPTLRSRDVEKVVNTVKKVQK